MKENFKEKIMGALSVPYEMVSDVPRIVLDSNKKVYIENYKGITEYSGECISINAGKCILTLTGDKMEIKGMTTEEIIIEGIIDMVKFS